MKLTIEKLDNFGRGIAYINDKICFIENALPGEEVEVKINNEKKKFYEAEAITILKESPLRIETECPYSRVCGGCQCNHMCYNAENNFKIEKIKSLLQKYGSLKEIKMNSFLYHDRNHYRNKIVLHGKNNELGLYQKESNQIIPISSCLLGNETINEMIQIIRKNNYCIQECTIKTSNDQKSIMVSITGEIQTPEELLKKVDVLEINGEYLTEKHSILTNIGKKKYYEGLSSFFQVNPNVTKDLYDLILEEVKGKKYKECLDLYCGCGTIGIYISDYVESIIGIDNNPSNIKHANLNKELNQCKNMKFILGDVEENIHNFKNIDLIIVDPPRSGLDSKTRSFITKINPKEIIYVSCDPVTLSRDLNELQENYTIREVNVLNMFPRTYHVETVSVLYRKTIEK